MLGSDAKKIEFFKEFEMWDQLRALYDSKSRWFELFALLMDIGELPAALNTILVHRIFKVVEKPTVEKVFHYTMAEFFYAWLGVIQKNPEWDNLLNEARSAGLGKLADEWKTPFNLMESFDDPNNTVTVKAFEMAEVKDFFCLFVRGDYCNCVG